MADERARQKGEEQPVITGQEEWKKYYQLVAQAWSDDKLKQRLLKEPASVLREHGMKVPPGAEVRVAECTDKVYYFVLPPKPAHLADLTSSQLGGVTGGATINYVLANAGSKIVPPPPTYDPYCIATCC